LSANNKRRKDIYRLPRADVELIRGIKYRDKLECVDRAILENAHFLLQVVENADMFGRDVESSEVGNEEGDDKSGREEQDQAKLSQHDHVDGKCFRNCKTEMKFENDCEVENRSHASPHSHSQSHHRSHDHDNRHDNQSHSHRQGYRPSEGDMDKLRSSLKQLVRDWSIEVCFACT
jgi:carnosine N-methyltransferase